MDHASRTVKAPSAFGAHPDAVSHGHAATGHTPRKNSAANRTPKGMPAWIYAAPGRPSSGVLGTGPLSWVPMVPMTSRRPARSVFGIVHVLGLAIAGGKDLPPGPTGLAGLAGPAGLTVNIRARSLSPGEPVRIVISAPASVPGDDAPDAPTGTFLGRAVHYTRQASSPARTWAGWSLVPLDAQAGPGMLELQLPPQAGEPAPAVFRREVTILARVFPEVRLRVASKFVSPPPAATARAEQERRRLETVYARRSEMLATGPFLRPAPGQASDVFGTRRIFNGEWRSPHPGLDLRAATGTPVLASGQGEVALAEDLYYSGGTVILDHGGGLFTVYAHLSRIEVEPGAKVGRGERLGRSGATGRVTGPHLHWGAKVGNAPFDPAALLDPVLFAP